MKTIELRQKELLLERTGFDEYERDLSSNKHYTHLTN